MFIHNSITVNELFFGIATDVERLLLGGLLDCNSRNFVHNEWVNDPVPITIFITQFSRVDTERCIAVC